MPETAQTNADPGHEKHVRDYVVLHEQTLADLVLSVLGDEYEELSPERVQLLQKFDEPVLTRVTTTRARNATHAKRQAGHGMQRPDAEARVVQLVAVPERQWSSEPVTLRPKLDVEVG